MSQLNETNFGALYGSSGSQFPNNSLGLITPLIMRTFGQNLLDSFVSNVNDLQGKVTASGTNTYAITGGITSYSDGYSVFVKFTNANSGVSTLNVATIGAKKIFKDPTTQATTGDIAANSIKLLVYDSALDSAAGGFAMIGGTGSGGGGTWGSITGTLSNQTDLQAALNLKLDSLITIKNKVASYPLAAGDLIDVNAGKNLLFEMDSASANDFTVPTNASVAFPIGTQILVKQIGAGLTTIVAAGGVTITGSSGSLVSPGQYALMALIKKGTDEWYLENGSSASGGGTVESVTGDGVDNTDPANPVLTFPTTTDIGAQPVDADLTDIAALTASNDDFIQRKAGSWTNRTIAQVKADLSLSGSNTGDQTITLTGEATGSGTGSFAVTLTNSAVIDKVLTGYTSGAGTVSATDSILQAIQKLNGNITALGTPVTSVSGTTNRITSSGGATPTIDISASYVGQSSITTLGTIGTGTWQGTSITPGFGGTGQSTYAVGDLLYASGVTTLSKLAAVAVGKYLGSQGTTTAPAWVTFPYVTPEMYGAVGDDSTDDAMAFTNAIATGLPLFLGIKTYKVGSTLTIPSNYKIFGSGAASIIHTTANIPILTLTSASNIQISDIVLKGSSAGSTQRGIYAHGNVGFTQLSLSNIINGCGFVNFGADGIYADFIIGSSSGSNHEGTYQVSDCWFTGCANGVLMDTRGEYNSFSNCKFYLNTTGVQFKGGNNNILGGSITDNTTGLLIGSGTNDGHGTCVGVKINHNGSNVTSSSTATGFLISSCEIISGSITLTSCTDIRFYNNDISAAPITSTSAVGTIFLGNCFRTTPTITIAAGNNPVFVENTFPSGSTVHSLIVNTVQGGFSQTQQGPTSPNTFTSTWTTTASAQFAHKFNGTLTPRATASDTISGVVIDISLTATANTQNYYDLDVNPTGTLATGGFTGTEVGAIRTRGKVRFRGTATSGAVTATSGFSYEDSGGAMVMQVSDDGIRRIGNAGSPAQETTTSDGLVINKSGNGLLFSTGAIGSNFSATNSGAGTVNSRGVGIIGGSTISSGTTEYAALRIIPTHNQTGSATGDVLGIDYNPTLTAVLGSHYFIRNRSIAANSAFAMTAAPTAKIHIGAGVAAASGAPLKFTSGTNMTTAEAGAFEYDGTNLFFTRAGTTRENVLVAVDNATAPSTTAGVVITNYYGSSATNFLGDPNRWMSVNILGVVYKVPLFT